MSLAGLLGDDSPPSSPERPMFDPAMLKRSSLSINAAPSVAVANEHDGARQSYLLSHTASEMNYNLRVEDMDAPYVGPATAAGVTPAQNMRRNNAFIGNVEVEHVDMVAFYREYHKHQGGNVKLESAFVREEPLFPKEASDPDAPKKKHKKDQEGDEIKKRRERGDCSTLHVKDLAIFRHGSFMNAPPDVKEDPDIFCQIPRKCTHTYLGHNEPVNKTQWFPGTGHLLLSASADAKVKLWDINNNRNVIRTYYGHLRAVRDISFSHDGRRFLSAGYDENIKLWDTETGQCLNTWNEGTIPYCVQFNPDPEHGTEFLVGCANKKVLGFETESKKLIQDYDRHLGPVNSVVFVDQNRRFISTSDDKSMRMWEYGFAVESKILNEPTMHSQPAGVLSPSGQYTMYQGLDNQISIYKVGERFYPVAKKKFRGHQLGGFACRPCFSCDGRMVVSGDAGGNLWFWDWKTNRIIKKMSAVHEKVTIGVDWHPLLPTTMVSCSWDGTIKLWQ